MISGWLNGPRVARLRALGRWDWQAITVVLSIKVVLFFFATQAARVGDSLRNWKEIWNWWDAVHYLSLAERGYTATGEERYSIVFYPLYPWLVWLAHFITRDYSLAAFFVSAGGAVAAGLLLKKLVRLDHREPVARNALWFLFIFPTSYFLHIGYTESLFLAFILGCFLAARTDRWFLAGLLGGCASLTRVNGLLVMPCLMIEACAQYRRLRRIDLRWLWLALVPLGFLVYLWLNYHVTGDPFGFSKIMEEHWFKKFTPPWIGIRDVWRRLPGNAMEGSHELFFIVLSGIGTLWCWAWLRPSYAIWMTLNWLLINSTSFVVSVPRYTLTLFPLFILFARVLTGRRVPHALLTTASVLFLGLYVERFVRGLWAF